ncbi:ATP-binding cassette subfamily B protein [Pedobacter cryoconitis]|uniref:ATP-binding cassette subfamily B protein n=1 Tax=Pedobacter cryoconitis TaxID=188932 RepID=A0A7W8YTQ0_9SPHI|nr:peptidase domain-containing ABC transporter [Pedobacter cryoconitis]MBB5621619.1 ATP-binding cassette subfamily B protein [Pedobacter cryoconitis]
MIKFIPQHDQMDCGPACLAMLTSHYEKNYSLRYLRDNCFITREGVTLQGIGEAAEHIGMEHFATKASISRLTDKDIPLPAILYWNQNHFVVLDKIRVDFFSKKLKFYIADPGYGFITLSQQKFESHWLSDHNEGVALLLSPTEKFYELQPPVEENKTISYLFNYLKPFKISVWKMFFLLLLGSLSTLIFPFLNQGLIDKGVNGKDLNLITLILIAQLSLFLGNLVIDLFRNWIIMVVGTKINIQIISDFLKRLLKLPVKFFDTKLMGDFNQRIQDHERIEQFLTSQSLLTFFSMITFLVFFGVLWYYSVSILLIYLTMTSISLIWSFYWLKKRKSLDYFRFQQRSENQQSIYEIINGVTELKLNQFEDFKREEWTEIQQKLFKTNIRILKVDQLQIAGFEFLNQTKNILVTFLSATLVVKGNMTLGELLAISYIIGQLNSPVNQLTGFFRSLQDAKLSLERLNELHNQPAEEQPESQKQLSEENSSGISFHNLSFQYEGPMSPFVLKDINFTIPEGKITAIVGASGSGKTTLMKLLLRFYEPTCGAIFYNHDNILDLSPKSIREKCGVVMQDGFIFSDTIERNIATGEKNIDRKKLDNAVEIANISSFINYLPLKYSTKIGEAGHGISGGQRQRMLIARSVYKNPQYIFFDEATSALDAENEKIIHNNLQSFFKGKTVVIIAHRLSTVKNADQIIVLKQGEIVEKGSHTELIQLKNNYYNLVKNQLELGN